MKKTLWVLTVVVCLPVALLAAEFWESRPYADWSDKETGKLLEKSPWAQHTFVPMMGRGQGGGGGGGGGRRRPGAGPEELSPAPGGVSVLVRWESALPIRQALLRAHYGPEVDSIQEAQTMLQAEVTHYTISITGLPARMGRDPSRLASAATLSRKGQEPIVAETAGRQGEDERQSLLFYFPRTSPIQAQDKDVEFKLQMGRLKVSKKFKLNKMLFKGNLEL